MTKYCSICAPGKEHERPFVEHRMDDRTAVVEIRANKGLKLNFGKLNSEVGVDQTLHLTATVSDCAPLETGSLGFQKMVDRKKSHVEKT